MDWGKRSPTTKHTKEIKTMNAGCGYATMILIVCAVVLVGLAMLAPCFVQNVTNDSMGSDDDALSNIQESLDKLNDKAESSALAEWLNDLDARSE